MNIYRAMAQLNRNISVEADDSYDYPEEYVMFLCIEYNTKNAHHGINNKVITGVVDRNFVPKHERSNSKVTFLPSASNNLFYFNHNSELGKLFNRSHSGTYLNRASTAIREEEITPNLISEINKLSSHEYSNYVTVSILMADNNLLGNGFLARINYSIGNKPPSITLELDDSVRSIEQIVEFFKDYFDHPQVNYEEGYGIVFEGITDESPIFEPLQRYFTLLKFGMDEPYAVAFDFSYGWWKTVYKLVGLPIDE